MRADRLPGLPLISQLPRRTARQTRALEKNNFVCVTCYPFLIVSGSEVSEAVSVVKLWFYVCVCVCARTGSSIKPLGWGDDLIISSDQRTQRATVVTDWVPKVLFEILHIDAHAVWRQCAVCAVSAVPTGLFCLLSVGPYAPYVNTQPANDRPDQRFMTFNAALLLVLVTLLR